MDRQICFDDLIREDERKEEEKVTIPLATDGKAYKIPDDVWESRCRFCVHKHAEENRPVPMLAVYKPMYSHLIPCRIMTVAHPNDQPGECMSFAPKQDTYGICETCRHNNIFADGFCLKKDHAPQRRVFMGHHYNVDERLKDYYGRHRLSTCDDYEPEGNGLKKMEGI